MSDVSEASDKESLGEKDDDFNIADFQEGADSDESFNNIINCSNATKHGEEEEENDSSSESQNQDNNEYVGPVLPGGHRFDKKLLCIRYPANVINPEMAIKTMGSLADISTTVNTKNRRLELRFRPDDGYCKPTCGDRHQTSGFLLRIRVKKSRKEKVEKDARSKNIFQENNASQPNNSTNGTSDVGYNITHQSTDTLTNTSMDPLLIPAENQDDIVSEKNQSPTFDRNKYENLSEDTEYQLPKLKVLGRVDTEFRFSNLCDFQYLPITKNKNDPTKDECIYDSIYPQGLPPYSWLKEEVPYFLPPAAFSRMDNVQQYVPKSETSISAAQYVIGKTRKRRSGFSNYINFHTPYVPTNPPKGIETAMKVKFLQSTHVENMRKAFQERPIWSKNALMFITKYSSEQLKILLPSVAYYFMTGPWRITWVRLGYDPRKDPEARKYQTLDYRLKAMHGLHNSVTCKRNYAEYSLPYRNTNIKKKTVVLMSNTEKLQSERKQKVMDDNVYIYRPGTIPPSRQMFYQYCDLYVPEIQDMFDKYLGPPPGAVCHEKLGWLPPTFDEMCREIINKQVRAELRKLMNIPENHPTSLPRKRKFEITSKKKKKRNRDRKKEQKTESQFRPAESMSILEDEHLASEDEWEDVIVEENADPIDDNDDEDGNVQQEENNDDIGDGQECILP
ncbi:general transcription factor 3C polypeptide 5 [Phymastichus coffea]|uniref:general transcription factor 3C polypeptide 5 n=1 Tax=Phymastichus coffea TaxID=108790 RepID=UPI00273BB1CA|nr:general transcription factor 3C polypeptide 5 [Phymastichus coffea]